MDSEMLSVFDLLLFESCERLSRFYAHMATLKGGQDRSAPSQIDEYEECLFYIMRNMYFIWNDSKNDENALCVESCLLDSLFEQYQLLAKLHTLISHLPRSSAPVEIYRFSRILRKFLGQAPNLNRDQGVTIYLSEETSSAAYNKSPISRFMHESVLKENKTQPRRSAADLFYNKNFSHHLTIPRVDGANPCVWPSLVHEFAHIIMHDSYFKKGSILDDFQFYMRSNALTLPCEYSKKFESTALLESWLVEIWCDLFAAMVMGPSFWFSQYASTLFASGSLSDTHPNPMLRLAVIKDILNRRFNGFCSQEIIGMYSDYERLLDVVTPLFFDVEGSVDSICCHTFTRNASLRNLAMIFIQFFSTVYFNNDADGLSSAMDLKDVFKKLIKYSHGLNPSTIDLLVEKLENNYPIPSLRLENGSCTERETYVQEILLAAWIGRHRFLRKRVIQGVSSFFDEVYDFGLHCKDLFRNKVVEVFKEFDYCVMRSLQVSEYVHLLSSETDSEECIFENSHVCDGGFRESQAPLLNDSLIHKSICQDRLKVIPLISTKQLGSTSLDIRLGTSFQVYYPNKSGIVDFADADSLALADKNSIFVDLDFLESIVISPGQFVLGHTMEYFGFPDNMAAELEGRSSFARLGLEIHMTAGFIDPGFHGVITLELYNAGPNPVKLYPGLRVGQLRFFTCEAPIRSYNRNPDAKYRGLLSHRGSLHFKDYEIALYKKKLKLM